MKFWFTILLTIWFLIFCVWKKCLMVEKVNSFTPEGKYEITNGMWNQD